MVLVAIVKHDDGFVSVWHDASSKDYKAFPVRVGKSDPIIDGGNINKELLLLDAKLYECDEKIREINDRLSVLSAVGIADYEISREIKSYQEELALVCVRRATLIDVMNLFIF